MATNTGLAALFDPSYQTGDPELDALFGLTGQQEEELPPLRYPERREIPRGEAPVRGEAPLPTRQGGRNKGRVLTTASKDLSPEARALLDTIAGDESPDYNTIYGGRKVSDLSRHPGIAVPIRSGPNAGRTSSAAGRYQFLGSTWNDQAKKLGLSDFSPESQDLAAWNLARETYGPSLEADLRSGDPAKIANVGRALRKVWTSLPGGIEQGAQASSFSNRFQQNLGAEGAETPDLIVSQTPQALQRSQLASNKDSPYYSVRLSDGQVFDVEKGMGLDEVAAMLQQNKINAKPLRPYKAPDGQEFDVEYDMTDDEIQSMLKGQKPATPEDSNYLGAGKYGAQQAVSGIAQGAGTEIGELGKAAEGASWLGEYGKPVGEFLRGKGEQLHAYGEQLGKDIQGTYERPKGLGWVEENVTYPLAETVGGVAPYAGAFMVPGVGPALGTAAVHAGSMGELESRAEAQGKEFVPSEARPYAVLDDVANMIGLGATNKLLKAFGQDAILGSREAIKAAVEKGGIEEARKVVGSRIGNIAKQFLGAEAGTIGGEVVEDVIGRAYTDQPLIGEDAFNEYWETTKQMAPLGGVTGMGRGLAEHYNKNIEVARLEEQAGVEQALQEQEAQRQKIEELATIGVTPEQLQKYGLRNELEGLSDEELLERFKADTAEKEAAKAARLAELPEELRDIPYREAKRYQEMLAEQEAGVLNEEPIEPVEEPAAPVEPAVTAPPPAPEMGAAEIPKAPEVAEVPPLPTLPTHFSDTLGIASKSGKKTDIPLRKALAQLDIENPQHQPVIAQALEEGIKLAEKGQIQLDVPKAQEIINFIKPVEVPSANRIQIPAAPDVSSIAQPEIRQEGQGAPVSSEGVRSGRQEIGAVKIPEIQEVETVDRPDYWRENPEAPKDKASWQDTFGAIHHDTDYALPSGTKIVGVVNSGQGGSIALRMKTPEGKEKFWSMSPDNTGAMRWRSSIGGEPVTEPALRKNLGDSLYEKLYTLDGTKVDSAKSFNKVADRVVDAVRKVKPLQSTKVVDEQGKPKPMYHGTGDIIEAFDKEGLGTHFTSDPEIASKFAGSFDEGSNVHKVFLDIKNPLRVKDFGGSHSNATEVAKDFVKQGILPKNYVNDAFYDRIMEGVQGEEATNIYESNNAKELSRIRKTLEDQGYDGLVYDNRVEGGGDTYVAFKPEQVVQSNEIPKTPQAEVTLPPATQKAPEIAPPAQEGKAPVSVKKPKDVLAERITAVQDTLREVNGLIKIEQAKPKPNPALLSQYKTRQRTAEQVFGNLKKQQSQQLQAKDAQRRAEAEQTAEIARAEAARKVQEQGGFEEDLIAAEKVAKRAARVEAPTLAKPVKEKIKEVPTEEDLIKRIEEMQRGKPKIYYSLGEKPAGETRIKKDKFDAIYNRYVRSDEKVEAGIGRVNPDAFLKATTSAAEEARIKQELEQYGPPDFSQRTPIELTIDEQGNIVDHEGRHRMMVLRDKGIKQVPVIIKRRSSSETPLQKRLSPQKTGGNRGRDEAFVYGLEPIHYDNRAKLEEAFVERPQIKESKGQGKTENPTDKVAVEKTVENLTGKATNWKVHTHKTLADAEQALGRTLNKNAKAFVTDGKAHFILENIPKGSELGVFLHEVGAHLGMERILSADQQTRLVDKVKEWAKSSKGVEGEAARAALEKSEGDPRETIAYFVEEAVNRGVNPTALNMNSAMGNWFRQLWAAMKTALRKLGIKNIDNLSAQDVVNLAYGAARLELSGNWHGSAKNFNKFSNKHRGTGEGGLKEGADDFEDMIAFGQYFAGKRGTAEGYRDRMVRRAAKPVPVKDAGLSHLIGRTFYSSRLGRDWIIGADTAVELPHRNWSSRPTLFFVFPDNITESSKSLFEDKTGEPILSDDEAEAIANRLSVGSGTLFNADFNIKDDEWLDYDKTLGEQSERVQAAVEANREELGLDEFQSAETYYRRLARRLGSEKAASEYLNSIGVKGVRYLDAGSRRRGKGTYNYVVFDPKNVVVGNKNSPRTESDEVRYSLAEGPTEAELKEAEKRLKASGLVGSVKEKTFTDKFKGTINDLFKEGRNTSFVAEYVDIREPISKAVQDLPDNVGQKLRSDYIYSAYEQRGNVIQESYRKGFVAMGRDGTIETVADKQLALAEIFKRVGAKNHNLFNNVLVALRVRTIRAQDAETRAQANKLLNMADEMEDFASTLKNPAKRKKFNSAARNLRTVAERKLENINWDKGRTAFTDQEVKDAETVLAGHPELVNEAENVYALLRKQVDLWENEGMIDKATADDWRKYPNYFPLYKTEKYDEQLANPSAHLDSYGAMMGKNPDKLPKVHRQEWHEHKVFVEDNLLRHITFFASAAAEHSARKNTTYNLEMVGKAERVKKDAWSDKDLIVKFRENGKDVFYRVDDIPSYYAMQSAMPLMSPLLKRMRQAGNFGRGVMIKNPLFWFRQAIREPIQASLVGRAGFISPFDTLNAVSRIASGSAKGYERLRAKGVIGPVDVIPDPAEFIKSVQNGKGLIDKGMDGINHVHEAMDAATRVVVYEKAKKDALSKGFDEETADAIGVMKAREIINFAKQGRSKTVRAIRATTPFFGAALNSLDVMARAAFPRTVGHLSKVEAMEARRNFYSTAFMLAAFSTSYAAMMSEDEDYLKEPDRVGNWLIPIGGGKFIKIPIPFEAGWFTKELPELAMLLNMGAINVKEAITEGKKGFAANVLPPVPTAYVLQPIMEVAIDHDFFTGSSIEGKDSDVMVRDRNSKASKLMTEVVNKMEDMGVNVLGVSANQLEHLARKYLGQVWALTRTASDAYINRGKVTPEKEAGEYPLVSGVVTTGTKDRAVNEFYTVTKEVSQVNQSLQEAGKKGDAERFNQIVKNPENVKALQASDEMKKLKEEIGELSTGIKRIENDQSLSSSEMTSRIKTLKARQTLLAKRGVEVARKLGLDI